MKKIIRFTCINFLIVLYLIILSNLSVFSNEPENNSKKLKEISKEEVKKEKIPEEYVIKKASIDVAIWPYSGVNSVDNAKEINIKVFNAIEKLNKRIKILEEKSSKIK